jgi:acetylornithine deacetylase/succinyl-diaminopimelate desuccinylase-like protein
MKILKLIFFLLVISVHAQPPSVTAARAFRHAHEHEIIEEFTKLLAIPNVASDTVNIGRNADFISSMLTARGVNTQLLSVPNVPPVVYGEIKVPGATRTLIIYAHYDGQPVEPAKWVGGDPFKPTLRSASLEANGKDIPFPAKGEKFNPEWRLYARASGDDKAPIIAVLTAIDALKANKIGLTSNIKFIFEGEEEAGSQHLESILAKYPDLVKGDVWLVCDGPVHQNRQQQIYFGARGVTSLELTVYGAKRELHSGHYGNWSPNPAMMLAKLLASMKDDDGKVLIENYYDGITSLSPTEKRALAEAADNDEDLKRELQIGFTEGGGKKLKEMLMLPSLNIRGLSSASTGATARNVIPTTATADIDIRLVKGIEYKVAVERVLAHIRKLGWHVVNADPDEATRMKYPRVIKAINHDGYNAARTSMDLEISKQVISAIENARGTTVRMPTLGGSVPLYIFTDILKTPAIGIPIANHDNNQHSSNENIRLQNLWDGIETMAALLTMK